MEEVAKLIPNSIVSLIGLAVIMGILVMLGTIFQEWAKSLWRRSVMGGKEKRHENKPQYSGIERRAENKAIEHSITELLDAMRDFVESSKQFQHKVSEDLEEIKRKQERNWKRLFDDELPSLEK